MHNIIETLRNKGQEVKAEAIHDCINREGMISLSLQNSAKTALDKKMRGCLLIRTSTFSEKEFASTRFVAEGNTGLSVNKAIQRTIFASRREEVRDERREREDRTPDTMGSAGVDFHTLSDCDESESQTDVGSLTNRTCGTRPMTQLNTKQRSVCVRPERSCNMRQHRTGSARKVATVVNVGRQTDQNPSRN